MADNTGIAPAGRARDKLGTDGQLLTLMPIEVDAFGIFGFLQFRFCSTRF
jgi:hypothetical protein